MDGEGGGIWQVMDSTMRTHWARAAVWVGGGGHWACGWFSGGQ